MKYTLLLFTKLLYIHFNITTSIYNKYLQWRYANITTIMDFEHDDIPEDIYEGAVDTHFKNYWLAHKEPNVLLKLYSNL